MTQTRHELETLRETTAQMLTAILTQMHRTTNATIAVPVEICQLADLGETAGDDADDDPITGEIPELVVDRAASLARLDRRFRWIKAKSQ